MKINLLCRHLMLAIGLALSLAACHDGADYINALPKDAAIVVSADLKSMVQKSGLTDGKGKQTVKRITDIIKSGFDGSDKLIEEIVATPDKSGLKLTDKVYFFMEEKATAAGMLARVSKQGNLENLFEALAKNGVCNALKESGGCQYTAVGNVLAAFNDKAFIIVADPNGGRAEDMVHTAQMLLRQKKGEGFAASGDFKKIEESHADIVSFLSADILPVEYTSLAMMGMTSDIDIAKVKGLAEISFEKGKVTLDIQNLTTDKTVIELTKKQHNALLGMKGVFLSQYNANTLCLIGGGIDGKAYFKWLNENPTISQVLSNSMIPVDFEAILGAMKGDWAIAVNMTNPFSPSYIFTSEVSNSTFLSTFEDLKPMLAMTGGQMSLQNEGDKAYRFIARSGAFFGMGSAPVQFFFGVDGNRFYFTNNQEMIDVRPKGLTLADTEWGKQAKGKSFFMGLNFGALNKALGQRANLPILNSLDYLAGGEQGTDKAHIELALKDKKHNILELIAAEVK